MTGFLDTLFAHDDLVEIRGLKRIPERCRRWWIPPADYPHVEPTLRGLNGTDWEMYFGVNARTDRASTEDAVKTVRVFYADVDAPSRVPGSAGKNPTEGTVPPPTVVVDSGHGQHLYWVLREPVEVTPENRPLLKAVNRGLALAVGGDPVCCDLARILRLPSFTNWKAPAAEVRLLQLTDRRYDLATLQRLAVIKHDARPAAASLSGIPPVTPQLEARFHAARRADRSGDLTKAWRGEIGDGSSDSRYVLVKGLLVRRFMPEEITAIVCSRRWYNRRSRRVRPPEDVFRDVLGLLAKVCP